MTDTERDTIITDGAERWRKAGRPCDVIPFAIDAAYDAGMKAGLGTAIYCRLAEVDTLMAQAVKFAEGYMGKLDQQHGTLACKYGQYVEVCAFLASPDVRAWRERQKGTS